MTEEEFKEKRKEYLHKLNNFFYFGLIGLMILIYSIDNIKILLNISDEEYYSVPKILSWFFDFFGPVTTVIVMLVISVILIGLFIFKCIEYRKNINHLKSSYQNKNSNS